MSVFALIVFWIAAFGVGYGVRGLIEHRRTDTLLKEARSNLDDTKRLRDEATEMRGEAQAALRVVRRAN